MIGDRLRDRDDRWKITDTQERGNVDGLPAQLSGKEFTFNAVGKGDTGLSPASGRSPGRRRGNP